MGIKQNYLYRVVPGLVEDGLVIKEGRGSKPKGRRGSDRARVRSLNGPSATVTASTFAYKANGVNSSRGWRGVLHALTGCSPKYGVACVLLLEQDARQPHPSLTDLEWRALISRSQREPCAIRPKTRAVVS
jgi:hypothetical protein